ncbi:MAG: S8 family peptidase [Ferruginibacter sp.]
MKRTLSLLCICLFLSLCSQAQFTRYIIRFRDKGTNPFSISNPGQYLTQRALDRRARYNISIDSSDLPITPRYIDSVRLSGAVTILNSSKWLNQIAIQTSDAAALTKINSLPFVISSFPVAPRMQQGNSTKNKFEDSNTPDIDLTPSVTGRPANADGYYNYGKSNGQVKIHHGDFLHDHGFRGEGMQMTVLDAGFFHYLTLPTFDSIRNNNQVLGTWDFVANEASVNEDYVHGMQCLSTIAANIPGTFVGTAPKASFYLYRTEDVSSEYPIEEQNLAAGAERSDSLGVDIFSISLGYSQFDNATFDYTYADMNGNTSISARAADIAAQKGILLVIAAGNEGNGGWHYLITPSDADSVLCVGAVDTTGQVAGFSSYGPSSDGQVKPGVAAVGLQAVVANSSNGLPAYGSGTSFACPNMAGISTCLWQAFPEINNMGIIDALEVSASRYSTPDNRVGYGIPDAKKAFVILQKKLFTRQASISNCTAQLRFSVKADNTMSEVIERKLPGEADYTTVSTLQNNGAWGKHDLSYDDNIGSAEMGAIKYRIKMIIASDTSFYLDSMSVNNNQVCNTIVTENNILITQDVNSEKVDVTITRSAAAKINISIRNALGQKIYTEDIQQPVGTLVRSLDMKKIAGSRGIYFITVYVDNKKAKTKQILRP